MAVQTQPGRQPSYPEGEALQQQLTGRRRRANFWSIAFLVCTLVGIISLTALLYNIINGAFGYVAVQNAVDPDTLVLAVEKERFLALPNLQTSEDDEVLAAGVAGDPNAIGFFGYAYYHAHADQLKALPVEGIAPSAETI